MRCICCGERMYKDDSLYKCPLCGHVFDTDEWITDIYYQQVFRKNRKKGNSGNKQKRHKQKKKFVRYEW